MTQKRTIVAPESKLMKHAEMNIDSPSDKSFLDRETPAHKRALQKYESKQVFLYPVERLTQSKLVIMNVKFPGSDEAYPLAKDALFRFVSKFYPNAKGGAIYVDTPRNEREIYMAYERHKVMTKLKLRHVISEKDSTYEDLLEQLEDSRK